MNIFSCKLDIFFFIFNFLNSNPEMIDKILKDWNDRVGGNLNHEKESHLFELGSMLWEQGWSSEQIGELVKNLKEQETKFKGRTKDGDLRYFKSKQIWNVRTSDQKKIFNSKCSLGSTFSV